ALMLTVALLQIVLCGSRRSPALTSPCSLSLHDALPIFAPVWSNLFNCAHFGRSSAGIISNFLFSRFFRAPSQDLDHGGMLLKFNRKVWRCETRRLLLESLLCDAVL